MITNKSKSKTQNYKASLLSVLGFGVNLQLKINMLRKRRFAESEVRIQVKTPSCGQRGIWQKRIVYII